jgi:hypothetical protein
MGFRIAHREVAPKARPQKDPDYLSWLHTLPCIVSGRTPIQAAHVNTAAPEYGHDGRGKGQKAHDCYALPLHWELHDQQGRMNELDFWKAQGINPYASGLVLFAIYSRHKDKHEATQRATHFIEKGGPRQLYKGVET